MKNHSFTLEPYKGMHTRYRCPQCNKERIFTRYIDSLTGEHLHPSVGRCDRENNCGYHYTPKQYFTDHNIQKEIVEFPKMNHQVVTIPKLQVSFISFRIFRSSLQKHEDNHFIQFLVSIFGMEITSDLIGRYFIGTSKHWEGSTVFWQIDILGKIRSGKVMLYDPVTGKRVKEPFSHITWVHKLLKQEEFMLKQCFYGEHLLRDKTKPVAIVESEKTAIIASIYLKQFTWLAVGSLNNLNPEKCEVLRGRFVVLFPDLNGFNKWTNKAKELSAIATFIVSDLLERKATEEEKKKGLDLADYLTRYNYKEFALPETVSALPPFQPAIRAFIDEDQDIIIKLQSWKGPKENLSEPWENEIKELEGFFKQISLPDHPVKLNHWTTICDPSQFIQSHLETVKTNNGKSTFSPYLNRLQELKELFTLLLN